MAWGRKDQEKRPREKSVFYFFEHKAFLHVLIKCRYHWLLQFFISLIINQLFSRSFFRIFHPLLLLFQCGLCLPCYLLWDIPFSFFLSNFTSPENKLPLIKWFLVSWQNSSIYFCHVVALESLYERAQHKATQMSAPLRRYHQLIICD